MNGGEHDNPDLSNRTTGKIVDIRDFLANREIRDYLKLTMDRPYEGIGSPESLLAEIEETKLRVFEFVTGNREEAASLASRVKVDFGSSPLFLHNEGYYSGPHTELDEAPMVEILNYDNGRVEVTDRFEIVLPLIIRTEIEPSEYLIIPSVPGGREFRHLDDYEDRITDADKINLMIAMGVAHIAVYGNDRLFFHPMEKETSQTITEELMGMRRLINGRININSLPEKNRRFVDRSRLLWGLAIEAVGVDPHTKQGLIDALLARHEEEIPSYQRNTDTVEQLVKHALHESGLAEEEIEKRISALELDPLRLRADQDSISELWLAAGEPMDGRELRRLVRKFYLKSVD